MLQNAEFKKKKKKCTYSPENKHWIPERAEMRADCGK